MKTALFMLITLSSLFMSAQENTCDSNSCIKRKAGDYQIELIKKCSDHLNFLVLDHQGKSILDSNIIGYVDFFYLDKTYSVEELYQFPKTNSLQAAIPCTGFYDIKITLVIKKQTISTYFNNECTLKMTSNFGNN